MCVHRSYMCGCFLVLYFFSTIFRSFSLFFFFFNDTATTEIYTLSLHDALPIARRGPDAGAITLLPIGVARHAERRAGPRQILVGEEVTVAAHRRDDLALDRPRQCTAKGRRRVAPCGIVQRRLLERRRKQGVELRQHDSHVRLGRRVADPEPLALIRRLGRDVAGDGAPAGERLVPRRGRADRLCRRERRDRRNPAAIRVAHVPELEPAESRPDRALERIPHEDRKSTRLNSSH